MYSKHNSKPFDANPQKMLSPSEVYNALATGVIDGQENTCSNIQSKKFFEMQKDTTVSDHDVLEYALVTNKRFWSSLPDDIRLELEKIILPPNFALMFYRLVEVMINIIKDKTLLMHFADSHTNDYQE